jgi:hypothetical protein
MSHARETESNAPVELHSLGGQAATPEVVEAWRTILLFPETARPGFWNLFRLAVLQPASPQHGERIAALADEYGIEPVQLRRGLEVCDLFVGSAASRGLKPEQVRHDLARLGSDVRVAEELVQQYVSLYPIVRSRLTEAILGDHGNLLIGLGWRVDQVVASDRLGHPAATVVFLTVHYRNGDEESRLTLQMTPESIKSLKEFTDRFGA